MGDEKTDTVHVCAVDINLTTDELGVTHTLEAEGIEWPRSFNY